jgi:hypothetical protein
LLLEIEHSIFEALIDIRVPFASNGAKVRVVFVIWQKVRRIIRQSSKMFLWPLAMLQVKRVCGGINNEFTAWSTQQQQLPRRPSGRPFP